MLTQPTEIQTTHCAVMFSSITSASITVLKSAAGFYIGRYCEEEGPISRESADYWPTFKQAQEALSSNCWLRRNNV